MLKLCFSFGRGGAFSISNCEGTWGNQTLAPSVGGCNFIRVKSRLDPFNKFIRYWPSKGSERMGSGLDMGHFSPNQGLKSDVATAAPAGLYR
jgi:hypothetical protein